MQIHLNQLAWPLCREIEKAAARWRVARHRLPSHTLCWDFGNQTVGSLAAGVHLARICLADLAEVTLVSDHTLPGTGLGVLVTTDHPYLACMASQYAGWKIQHNDYFAMGSGPMRSAAGQEPLLATLPREATDCAVGVLESSQLPTDEVACQIAERCHVDPARLCLLVARTASQAGTVQVVARSVETTLHKLHSLGFPLERIESGAGLAPLPPVAKNDLRGIGRTNDAILYGARVTLWCRGDDDSIAQVIEQIPSCSSRDYGQPFYDLFARYDHDFYKIDAHLFSPAHVQVINLDTGRSFFAGQVRPDLLQQSFFA